MNIEHIAHLNINDDFTPGKRLTQLFDGIGRRVVCVELEAGDSLAKHKANEPITVLCLAGKGRFLAGDDLLDVQELVPGTLITLEAEIPHEVNADSSLRLLVTKFKQY